MEVSCISSTSHFQTENKTTSYVGKESFKYVIILEKGRGFNNLQNDSKNGRLEGLAGRYDHLETSGVGPSPCKICQNVITRSCGRLDYFLNKYS